MLGALCSVAIRKCIRRRLCFVDRRTVIRVISMICTYSDEERSKDEVGSCPKMKSRGMMTTADLHDGSSLPNATLPPSLTLIPISLLQTIYDDANNRYDKSSETHAFPRQSSLKSILWLLNSSSEKETPKMDTQKIERRA